MNYCKDCRHYTMNRFDGPTCTKGRPKGASPLMQKECFEEKDGDADGDVILSSVPPAAEIKAEPEMAPAATAKKEYKIPPGRRSKHPAYVDEKTGLTMKWCNGCKTYKPLDDFPKNKSNKDGKGTACRVCHNARCIASQKKRKEKKAEAAAAERFQRLCDFSDIAPERIRETPPRRRRRTTGSWTPSGTSRRIFRSPSVQCRKKGSRQ